MYTYNNKPHYYHPDFMVNGQIYEIKGNQFWKEDGTMQCPFDHTQDNLYEAKHQCGLKNNVIFIKESDIKFYIDYICNKYGKDFLKSLYIR